MSFEQYLTDEQDPKTAEKVLGKLNDMLTPGEQMLYLAVQKKPAMNLIPDSVIVTDKRIVFCIPGNLGLTTNFEIFSWRDVKEVSFKEEFFGAKFTVVPMKGENFTVDYIPKVQARKLYQFSNRQLEKVKEQLHQEQQEKEIKQAASEPPKSQIVPDSVPVPPAISAPPIVSEPLPLVSASLNDPEDEVTLKLKKLKTLFEKQLISSDEYEAKKADILSQL
ncbi:PH domain-containing protein [Arcticibacter tournemirensis]